jgi:secondary thiamine-phosphate synthase enzyme
MSVSERITIESKQRTQFIDITEKIQAVITRNNVREGIVHIFVPHTTAAVTINENADPDVVTDIIHVLEQLVPWRGNYAHAEGNTAAHVKSCLFGVHTSVLVEAGKLKLGTWQGIFFCEFDGPRVRQVWVKVSKEP